METIHPHILCLSSARTYLSRQPPGYLEAFLLLRKYRLDLNILYDYDPSLFLAHTQHFVKSLDSVDYLNLFISALSPETRDFFEQGKTESGKSGKVNAVCDALRSELVALDGTKFLLPTLTTYPGGLIVSHNRSFFLKKVVQ